jgi:hypothetical protein
MAIVYVLGVSPSDGTAVCFGTEESGAFVPAIFEECRHIPGMTDTLKGVRFLIFDSHVTKIDAHAFEGAMDLETIAFEGQISSLGERAFANSPKLTCVVFSHRNPVDAVANTFEGAHAQLTAVYPRESNGSMMVMHPASIWKNMISMGMDRSRIGFLRQVGPSPVPSIRYDGPRVTADGWLFLPKNGKASLMAYLPPDRNAVELPAKIDGLDTTCSDYGGGWKFDDNLKIKKILADSSSLNDLKNMGRHRILATDGWAYVRLTDPQATSGSGFNAVGVPECTSLSDIATLTNGVPREGGYRYIIIGGLRAAIVGIDGERTKNASFSPRPIPNDGKGEAVAIPATLGGKPVALLPPGLFASRYDISSVVFPDTVEELPAGICYGCPILREVKLPKNLKRIGRLAFYDCPRLSAPPIPDGVTCETWAFDNKPDSNNKVILKP